jgi:hypothetical protein
MKSVRFWRMEVQRLSLTERIFFRDAIRTLLSWETIEGEYLELEVIRKILDSEITIVPAAAASYRSGRKNSLSKRQLPEHQPEQTGPQDTCGDNRQICSTAEDGRQWSRTLLFSSYPSQYQDTQYKEKYDEQHSESQ